MLNMLAFLLQLGATPAMSHLDAVEQALFDLCPRVQAGTLSLSDADGLARLGYAPQTHRDYLRAVRGAGDGRVYLQTRGGQENSGCTVVWGGPDYLTVLEAIAARARANGYSVTGPTGFPYADSENRQLMIGGGPAERRVHIYVLTNANDPPVFGGVDLAPHAVALGFPIAAPGNRD